MYEINLTNTSMPIVCGCDFRAAPEPFSHADRVLDFNVLIYVTEGVIYVTEEDTDYAVMPGELLFLKSGSRHYGKTEIPKGTKWYFIHFYLNEDESLPSPFDGNSPVDQYFPVEFTHSLPKKLTDLNGSDIENTIRRVNECFHSSAPHDKWMINPSMHELLSGIMFFGAGLRNNRQPSLSEKICRFLDSCSNLPFSSEMVEKEFYLSYKYMSCVFRSETGMTMLNYHSKVRINTACRMLRTTILPIGVIAEELGYADPLYFSRCFRTAVGISPKEYRSRMKQEY